MSPFSVEQLPPGFCEHFDAHALANDVSTLLALDRSGTILWVNSAWYQFAHANEGADTLRRFGIGSRYFDGIHAPLRTYFEEAFSDALDSQQVFIQDYECSSPDNYRSLRLRVLPVKDVGLLLEHSLLVEEAHSRPEREPIDARYRDQHGLLRQCSNCRRVKRGVSAGWDWVRNWVTQAPAPTTHGLCDVCVGFYWRMARRKGTPR